MAHCFPVVAGVAPCFGTFLDLQYPAVTVAVTVAALEAVVVELRIALVALEMFVFQESEHTLKFEMTPEVQLVGFLAAAVEMSPGNGKESVCVDNVVPVMLCPIEHVLLEDKFEPEAPKTEKFVAAVQ